MPTYDYRCRKCGHVFELFHSIKDNKPKRCPKCGARADRLISGGAGLLFKGSGFYITDYRSRQYKERAKQEKGAGSKPEGGSSGSAGTPGADSKGSSATSPKSPKSPGTKKPD